MESKTKHIEPNQPSPPDEIHFLDLNDDCIFTIFDHLSKIDLCSMTFTCQRLQSLAFYHFQRKFPNESTKIIIDDMFSKTTLKFIGSGEKNHLKYFSKVIRNVVLFNLDVGTQQLYEFVKAECPPKLKTLYIYNTAKMYPKYGELLKDQLEDLESLCIREFHPETDIYEALVKHCKKLKKLTITPCNNGQIKWMFKRYGWLESMDTFTKGNPNYLAQEILNLEELLLINYTELITNLKAFLMPFVLHALRMEKLTLKFDSYKKVRFNSDDFVDLEAVCSRVQRACPLNIHIVDYRMKEKKYISTDCMLELCIT